MNINSRFVFPVPLGSIPELPAETCKEIKASEGKAVSGKYWLSSIKPGMSVLVHCNMQTGGELSCLHNFLKRIQDGDCLEIMM